MPAVPPPPAGQGPPDQPWALLIRTNLDPGTLLFAGIWLTLLLGPFWWWLFRRRARAPAELRSLIWLAVPVLLLYLRFGIWREVRILLPLVPLVIVVGLFALPEKESE